MLATLRGRADQFGDLDEDLDQAFGLVPFAEGAEDALGGQLRIARVDDGPLTFLTDLPCAAVVFAVVERDAEQVGPVVEGITDPDLTHVLGARGVFLDAGVGQQDVGLGRELGHGGVVGSHAFAVEAMKSAPHGSDDCDALAVREPEPVAVVDLILCCEPADFSPFHHVSGVGME